MKVTFPHMGNVYLASKALFEGLGIEYVIPPFSNKKALEIGSLYSPEEICLPFKITLGNYIQSIEQGADTIILTGSCGPCRFGEYCELQINILKKLGYNIDFIVIDAPTKAGIGKEEFIKRIAKIGTQSPIKNSQKIKAMIQAFKVINLIDYIEAKAHQLSGYELVKGSCKNLFQACHKACLDSTSPTEMINILNIYKNELSKIPIDKNKDPLKIAIIGEIYTIIEPFSNLYLENKLMDYGVSTSRHLTPSWWVKDMALKPLKLNSLDLRTSSKKYLPYYIGGHGRECIGEVMLAQKSGYDGAIQIFPMGCMPEIVTKSILPTISKDKDFPIMTLIVDEMTGEAGYITRIEAFVDMLERRKNINVLHGCRRRFS